MVLKAINTKRVRSTAEEAVEPLSPCASMFHAPQMQCYIIAEMGCKTKIDVEAIIKGGKETLLKHPRFSSKLVFDKKGKAIGWARTEVIPDEHLFIPELDSNAIESPDKFVEDYVSNLSIAPMDFSRPLWEVHILHIKTSKANSVGIFRIHHSMGDGISLITLLLACTRKNSDPDALPSLPLRNNNYKDIEDNNTTNNIVSLGLWGYFLLLLVLSKVLWNTLVDIVMFMVTMVCLKDTNTPLMGSNPGNIENAPRRFVNRTVSLDDIKLVKSAVPNSTINDVILGITQAGLSRYLNTSTYGKANGDERVHNNNIRVRATLLVNLRSNTSIEGLAEMMEGESKRRWKWGNSIAYILLPFHIGLKDDPLDYIRDAKATIHRKKLSLEVPATFVCAKLILKTLGARVATYLTHRALCNTTMSFSNVVGPMEEISFYGHTMVYLAPSVYGHPHALTTHFQSYMDKMTFVLAVDPQVIPDPHKLCDDIAESLELCKDAIIEARAGDLIKS